MAVSGTVLALGAAVAAVPASARRVPDLSSVPALGAAVGAAVLASVSTTFSAGLAPESMARDLVGAASASDGAYLPDVTLAAGAALDAGGWGGRVSDCV